MKTKKTKKMAKGGLAAVAKQVKGESAPVETTKPAEAPPQPKAKAPSGRELIIRSLLNGATVETVGAELSEKNKWPLEKAKAYVGGYMSNIRQFAKLFAEVGFDKALAIAAK
jgi:hypothetical protein